MRLGAAIGLIAIIFAMYFQTWYGEVGSILMGVIGIIVWTDGRERADRARLKILYWHYGDDT